MPYSKDFSASVWKDIHSLISLDSGLDSVLVWAGVGWLCHGLGLVSAWPWSGYWRSAIRTLAVVLFGSWAVSGLVGVFG